MDYGKIKEAAQGYEQAMTKFLRDLVRIPGESVGEEGHVKRIEQEMNALGFDKVVIDPMGNILGYMGSGKTLIGFDAHIDTVGIGNRGNWEFDPYEGFESDTEIGGRGTSDQLGGIVSAVYGAKIDQELAELEAVYVRFNVSHPEGFRGRSMTMSDVVEIIRSEKESRFFFCDRFVFEEIAFEKEKADFGRL